MNWWQRLWRKREQEKRLEQELRFHIDSQVADNIRAGMSEGEARRCARLEFGAMESVKEECREARGTMWLESTWQDLRFSLRMLRKTPVFTLAAIATLALGIGVNTAIFSVTNATLLRTLPVHDPQQLVSLKVEPGSPNETMNTGNGETSFSDFVFERLRTRHDAFSAVIAHVPLGFDKITVRHGQEPEEADAEMTSGNLFSGLGVRMQCGRPFTLEDERNHAAVAVLSYAYLQRSFGEDCRNALGQTLFIKGFPFPIIGVAARGFFGVENASTDVWIPLQSRREFNAWGYPADSYYANANWWCLPLMARLAPGVSADRATAMVTPAFQRAAYEPLGGKPQPGEKFRTLALVPMRGVLGAEGEARPLTVLLGMVGLILIIACGNIAMLLVARNSARQREFSVRLAIGGSRGRLFRQLLTDSLLMTGAGASLGWIVSIVAKRALIAWAEIDFDVSSDRNVLLFAAGISLLAGIIFGVAPLFAAIRVPIGLALKSSTANLSQSHARLRSGRIIVALQVSVCLMLVVAAGLLVGTLRNLEHINLGLRTSGLVVFGVNPQVLAHSDAEGIRFYEALLDKLRALPGVESATLMENRIGSGWSNNGNAFVDGKDPAAGGPNVSSSTRWNAVGPDFFTTLRVPVLRGRDLNEHDSESAPKVAIVNETFAKRFLPGRDPLGHAVSNFSADKPFTIVGVVANSKYTSVRERDVPMAYFPYAQIGHIGVMHVEMRSAGDPNRLLPVIRKAVAAFSPDLALLQPMTQQAQFDETISEERLVARLSICFGALAVLLVVTGLYGTLAYNVSRRTPEIGIRMALGARRVTVLWMILREGLLVCAIGTAIGLPLTLLSASVLEALLFGLAPRDPFTICLATLCVIAVSVIAGFLPARRAAFVEPMIALRYE